MLRSLKRQAKGTEIHEQKATAGMATVQMPVPKQIVLLMKQHIGEPCRPVVKVGDAVAVGTLVGKSEKLGADIHSGVSGVVTAVAKQTGVTGEIIEAVTIEADGLQTIAPEVMPPVVRDEESFLQAVRDCGLIGLGGAGFPTAVKMVPPKGLAFDTLVVNAAECEPYITSDDREILENHDMILLGIEAVKKYLHIEKAVIGIERNKPESIDLLFSLTQGDSSIKVVPMHTRYPQGAEKVLIEKTLHREVPADGLPANVGVLVLNVCTVSTIGKYLTTGMPLTTRRLTVDGGAVARPQNVEVIVGTPTNEVLEFCGGFKEEPAKVLVGGPMMGLAMDDLNYPVIRQNNAILAFTAKEAYLPAPQPCIRCGRCVEACPVGLSPIELTEAYEERNVELLGKLSATVCMGCGVCSYVCPAKREVAQDAFMGRRYYEKKVKEENGNGA